MLAVDLAAVLDPIDMDLFGLIIHRVEDAPVTDPYAIALWDSFELADTRRSGILAKLLKLHKDPSKDVWLKLADLSLSGGLDCEFISLLHRQPP
jgi:hypothetical protein